ncbi:MAG TPA: hypothetical protein VED41_02035 [Solirubrobacteraceae bacterium]|nr:hypothetical protein [Solirubrobacteraceae bacterium]
MSSPAIIGVHRGQERAGLHGVERREPQRERGPSPQRAARTDHRLHHRDGRAAQDERELSAGRQVVPDGLDHAREPRRGGSQIGHLVEDHCQRLLGGECRKEAQGRLPACERAAREVGGALAETPTHRVEEPTELHDLGLLRGTEEDGPPPGGEVGEQEGLAHPAPAPDDDQLRTPGSIGARRAGQRALPRGLSAGASHP